MIYSPTQHHTLRDTFNNVSVILVTGPNMGGKSTLMRQAALLVILAHLVSCIVTSSFVYICYII